MKPFPTTYSVPLLRWTLGLAVILESGQFAFSSSGAHFFAKTGLPLWLRPTLGGVEGLFVRAAAVLMCVSSEINSTLSASHNST